MFHFTTLAARLKFAAGKEANGMHCHEFEEMVAGFNLICLAVEPRPTFGQIAQNMKQRKKAETITI